jgi:hypothetical protein
MKIHQYKFNVKKMLFNLSYNKLLCHIYTNIANISIYMKYLEITYANEPGLLWLSNFLKDISCYYSLHVLI